MTNDVANGSGDRRGGEDLGDGLLARVRESYNPPPEPPLEAMWGRIEEDRYGTRGATESRPHRPRRGRASWWLGMTAALVVGVGLGRASTDSELGGERAPHSMLSIATSEEKVGAANRPVAPLPPCEAQSTRAAQ
jgi:hypothetical protein